MSKINALRFINLNYNNNAIRISDETFHLNGETTLLSLRNGGGKSVLVQMITAPFVHKRYRDAKDRPFESYFTTAKPTFILVEWALDGGAGYVLTGMMVRKNQDLSEGSGENLEMINFISEYKERCMQDIHNLPVVEKTKKEVRLKSFHTCRQLFDVYKKDSSLKFAHYDMTNAAQSRQYFESLREYQINYKEWESIIKKVNLKESGLSDLFADCKDEKGLVEKWFLDAVENKLNQDKNRMREFQNIIQKYVGQYKDNKSKIQRRDTIRYFHEQAVRIEDALGSYEAAEAEKRDYENQIAAFIGELQRLEEQMREKIQIQQNQIDALQQQILHVEYEQISDSIYQLKNEIGVTDRELELLQIEQSSLEREKLEIEQKLQKMLLAKQAQKVQTCREIWELAKQKLKVSKQKQEELEPERSYLGFVLKCYYQQQRERNQTDFSANQQSQKNTQEQIDQGNQTLQKLQEELERQQEEMGVLRGLIRTFDEKEERYNNHYHAQFVRNILGEYEPGMLEICGAAYEKEEEQLAHSRHRYMKELDTATETLRGLERSREGVRRSQEQTNADYASACQQKSDYEKQLAERKTIMRYLDLPETELFRQEQILQAGDYKLKTLAAEKRHLEQEEDILQKEYVRLTQGKVLELTPEFENMLTTLDIHYLYGMEWLQKNGQSAAQNSALVKVHPFLPYSLILSRTDLQKLSTHAADVYTSSPVPLILREDLDKTDAADASAVQSFDKISFYLLFNENLLDEEKLARLVSDKEAQIRKKKQAITLKATEYSDYFSRQETIRKQDLTQEKYEIINQKIEELCMQEEAQKEQLRKLQEAQNETSKNMETLRSQIDAAREKTKDYARRREDFTRFCQDYQQYQEHCRNLKRQMEQCEKRKESRRLTDMQLKKYQTVLSTLRQEGFQLQQRGKELETEYQIYAAYERHAYEQAFRENSAFEHLPGADAAVNLSQQEQIQLKTRYEAITNQISSERRELEENQVRAKQTHDTEQEELRYLEQKYALTLADYKSTTYDRQAESQQEELLKTCQQKIRIKTEQKSKQKEQQAILKHDLKKQIAEMQKRFDKTEPLPKQEIQHTDFEAELNQLRFHENEAALLQQQFEKQNLSYGQNLAGLAEYETLTVSSDVQWEQDFTEMNAKQLREFQGLLKRDYNQSKTQSDQAQKALERLLRQVHAMDIFSEDFFKKPLEMLLEVIDDTALVRRQLSTITQSYDNLMQKLEVDISMVEKEKTRIAELLEEYIKEVHENIGKIDHNSTITIRDRAVKMLRLKIPEWSENENLYQIRLQDFMDEITKKGIELFEKNENAPEYFGTKVTTKNLYDSVVGISNVQIGLYKVEEYREYPITWTDVAKNSGGEGFLSAFVILSSLLYYMRRDDSDIFADRNEGKVLVMDNPFAQTNAAHLLKPLMEMAKKTNTQLICLSGLGGESIYNRFDNIYVLNLIAASLRNGMQYLKTEHLRGGEPETMVVSQVEVFEQQELLF